MLLRNRPVKEWVSTGAFDDGTFPPDFDQWDLETDDGETVIDIAREHGSQHVIAQYQAFLMRAEIKEKPADAAIHRKGITPI